MQDTSRDLDDLDLYDKDAADIRRSLSNIDLNMWCRDLYDLDPDLFDKLYSKLHHVKHTK